MAVDNSRASVAAAPARPLFSCLSWLIVFSLFAFAGCSSAPKRPPTGTPDPDRFLFERGTDELNDKDWFTAREYFRQLVDSYPQSPFRGDAKLGIGDYAPRRGHDRRLRDGDQRVQGVPVAVPDPQACGLRAVQAGDVALLPDARPDAGSDRNRGSDQGADGVRRAVSRTPSAARSIPTPRPSCGKPRTGSESTSWASACSTTSPGGIRARSSG